MSEEEEYMSKTPQLGSSFIEVANALKNTTWRRGGKVEEVQHSDSPVHVDQKDPPADCAGVERASRSSSMKEDVHPQGDSTTGAASSASSSDSLKLRLHPYQSGLVLVAGCILLLNFILNWVVKIDLIGDGYHFLLVRQIMAGLEALFLLCHAVAGTFTFVQILHASSFTQKGKCSIMLPYWATIILSAALLIGSPRFRVFDMKLALLLTISVVAILNVHYHHLLLQLTSSSWRTLAQEVRFQSDRLLEDDTDVLEVAASLMIAAKAEGVAPLHHAVAKNHVPLAAALLNLGAKKDIESATGASPLFMASQAGNVGMASALVHGGVDLNHTTPAGWTSVNVATRNGHLAVVQELVKGGADLDKPTCQGAVPLHCAADRGFYQIAQILVDGGAQVNARKAGGATPLYVASSEGFVDVVNVLLTAGANPSIGLEDGEGTLPIHVASRNGHVGVVAALKHAAYGGSF